MVGVSVLIGLILACGESWYQSDEVVYLITKTVAEMKDRLVKVNPAFQRWEPGMMPKGLGIDIHPGAVKYYKERGWL